MMTVYEFDGKKYQQASKHQKEWGSALIESLHFRGDESILDLGCGDGVLTEKLAVMVPNGKVLGIDASSDMLKTARLHQRENLYFRQMDINQINFDATFDIIYSNAALHWVQNHSLLLANSYKALKPGGKICWNFAGNGNCKTFFGVVRQMMRSKAYKNYFGDFKWPWIMPESDTYAKLVEMAGFKNIEVTVENRDRNFANEDEMIRWIDQPSLVPFLQHLPAAKKAAFREAVIDKMLQQAKQPDDTCFETFRRIQVIAVK